MTKKRDISKESNHHGFTYTYYFSFLKHESHLLIGNFTIMP